MNTLKFKYQSLSHKKETPELVYQWKLFSSQVSKLGISTNNNQTRLEQVFYSRLCIKDCLKSQGVDILWRDLLSKNYLELQEYIRFPLSLSHSKEQSLAVVARDVSISLIGADIEHKDRIISPKVQTFMSHRNDISMEPIKLWCLKEASFKAVARENGKVAFKSIKVKQDIIEIESSVLHWKIFEQNSHILAICWK